MAALISLGLFVALMTAITIFGYRRYAKPGRVYEQLGGPVLGEPMLDGEGEDAPGLLVSLLRQIGEKLPISTQDLGDASTNWWPLVSAGMAPSRSYTESGSYCSLRW